MRRQSGFTLAESLIVIAITGLLLLAAVPISVKHLESYREKAFFELFEMDLLQAQNLAMSRKGLVEVVIHQKSYRITHGSHKTIANRSLPDSYTFIGYRPMDTISFNENGSIRKSGNLGVRIGQKKYYGIILPPGKGRVRFEEQ